MPTNVRRRVRFGTAELVPDPWRPNGWILTVDDVPQSYVDLDDPTYLQMPYSLWIANAINHHFPAGTPISAIHIGGGACTLPRYLAATRPGSTQTVFDPDGPLVNLLREHLTLDTIPDVEVHVRDGRSGLHSVGNASTDLVILDVFRGAAPVVDLATVEFLTNLTRILRPGALCATNLWGPADLNFVLRATAALTTVFPHALSFAEPGVFMRWRPGNIVIAASTRELTDWTPTVDRVSSLTPPQLREIVGSAPPLTETDPITTPVPQVHPWSRSPSHEAP